MDEREWTRNATGVMVAAPKEARAETTLSQWPPNGAQAVEVESLYERLSELGLDYGPVFRGLHAAWKLGDDVFAEIQLPDLQRAAADSYAIHPALADAALHTFAVSLSDSRGDSSPEGGEHGIRLPFAWRGVSLHSRGALALRVRLSQTEPDVASFAFYDEQGAPVLTIDALVARELSPKQLAVAAAAASGYHETLVSLDWVDLQAGSVTERGSTTWRSWVSTAQQSPAAC